MSSSFKMRDHQVSKDQNKIANAAYEQLNYNILCHIKNSFTTEKHMRL